MSSDAAALTTAPGSQTPSEATTSNEAPSQASASGKADPPLNVVLASLLAQSSAGVPDSQLNQAVIDVLARMVMASQSAPPGPASKPVAELSPPPAKVGDVVKKECEGATAVPAAAPPKPEEVAPSKAPPPTVVAAVPLNLPDPTSSPPPKMSNQLPHAPGVYNSSTHPTEWKTFTRFCEKNPASHEMKRAFTQDT